MKKLLYVFLAIIFCQMELYCQKETAWWHFGYNSGLNFNSVSNVAASDGTVVPDMPEAIVGFLNTSEGCFAASTYDGAPLFSSDGSTVYDKNGDVMMGGTGLLGGSSSTQSGIAIPKPGSTTEYYVVTVPADYTTNPNGIRYSIVDISKNGGLGEVTFTNHLIKSGAVGENISAVPNANGKDYWLIHRTEQTFYVWAITSEGISTTVHQTISNSSIIVGAFAGEIIMSPDYTKLVSCTWHKKQVISANFNPATGLISDIKVQNFPVYAYGGTFSPNNKYIYIGSGYDASCQTYVNTWDGLRTGTSFTLLKNGISNLRKGMDNRLYGITARPVELGNDLYVILNPDEGGTNIKYFPKYLKNRAYLGLPTFVSGFIRVIPKEQPFACAANNRTYSVEVDLAGGNIPARFEWDFGDGTPIVTQTVSPSQSKYSQRHSYGNAGVYTITITPYRANGVALSDITIQANVVNCSLKTNYMTRSELLNSKQQ